MQGMMFCILALGWYLRKSGMIDKSGKALLSSLVMNVTLPASIVKSFQMEFSADILKLTVTVIGNCITIGWCISISLRINSDSYCLSVRLSTVTVFCTGIILSYPFEITDSLDWVHF